MPKGKSEYTDKLAEPLGPPPGILGSRDFAAEEAACSAEIDLRMHLLLDHFAISRTDPSRWRKLAFELAQAHVPGLKPFPYPTNSGRVIDVAFKIIYLVRFRGISLKAAASAIAENWPELGSAESVRLTYRESKARKSTAAVVKFVEDMERKVGRDVAKDSIIAALGPDVHVLDGVRKPSRGRPRKE